MKRSLQNGYKISSKPINGKWTVRTRYNNEYLGTIEPLGRNGKGYRAIRPNGDERIEQLRMFAALWLAEGAN